jgi:hypothetical protein
MRGSDRKSRRPHCQTGGTARVTIRRAFDQGIGFTLARLWWPGTLLLERQIKGQRPGELLPVMSRRPRAADRTRSFPSPDRRRTLSRPGSVKGCPKGRR